MDLKTRLAAVARRAAIPYCFTCGQTVPDGGTPAGSTDPRCPRCHSDDFGWFLPGVGYDWGTTWIIHHLLGTSITALDTEAAFARFVTDSYGETVRLGWLTLDVPKTIKDADPTAWGEAKRQWLDAEERAGHLVTFYGAAAYYAAADVEVYLATAEAQAATDVAKAPRKHRRRR